MVSTPVQLKVPTVGSILVPTGIFIENEWHSASDGSIIEIINLATGDNLPSCASGTQEDVNQAVIVARKAFDNTWGRTIPASTRGQILNRLADLMERDAHILSALESLNCGKSIRLARDADLVDAISCVRYYAGLADKGVGQTMDHHGTEKFTYTIEQPIGVCGQIIPWNYPIVMWAWKVAPALAAGCTIVMKPSELTPYTALYMCNLAKEAGLPRGVLNCIPGLGRTTGAAMGQHSAIDKIAFTGSVSTGQQIAVMAATSNLKRVSLELGGKSAALVFDHCDIEDAASWVAMGIFFNSGQDCSASSRVYVQNEIYPSFLEALKRKAEGLKIGKPEHEDTSFGPLISKAQRDKVLAYVQSGIASGARLVTGGRIPKGMPKGFWIEPTVLADVTEDMACVREEIFGPVIVAASFKTEAEAIKLANDSVYGLGAAVFTNDTRQATRVAHALDAGTVWINQYLPLSPDTPFGGFKRSGYGRDLGTAAMQGYLEIKSVHQNLSTDPMLWPF